MFEDAKQLTDLLSNPMCIASLSLKELENRIGGDAIVADPNSPACHLLEMSSSLTAAAIKSIDDRMPQIYPLRANTMEDLEHHMSDYDYLRMYANPATTVLQLVYAKKYLYENALAISEQLKKVTIPRDTVFTIGRYPFGMYYPVNILINTFTKSFTTVYDTTKINPLFSLTTNIVNNYSMTYKGVEYLVVEVPVYQFARSTVEKTVVSETGFAEKFVYNNNFYAIRIFTVKNNVYTELAQSQSTVVYDAQKPTALVRVLPDEHKIKVIIPQVYMTEKLMGSKIVADIYTTTGPLQIAHENLDASSITINYGLGSRDTDKYSNILRGYPYDNIVRLGSDISGGTAPVSFDTLRDRVVNDRLYETVPITEAEIINYLEDRDFTVTKYKDNVTDRIYYAYHVLEDSASKIVASRPARLEIAADYTDKYATCLKQSDDSFTILPTTWYRYNESKDCVYPLTLDEANAIINKGKSAFAHELNTYLYYKSPFHMRVDLANYYPKVVTFNLMTPEATNLKFDAENYNLTYKMYAYDALLQHKDNGVGGYELRISVDKTDDVKKLSEDDLLVYICTNTKDGYAVGGVAKYLQETGTRSVYALDIATNYHLTEDDRIGITNLQNESIVLSEHMIPMLTEFTLIFLIKRTAIVGSYNDAPAEVTQGVPNEQLLTHVGMSRQTVTLNFGHSLANVIKNTTEITNTSRVYETYELDVPLLYDDDVYQRNEDGSLAYTEEDGKISLIKLFSAGDQVQDANGIPVYKHRAGDVKTDLYGNPIVKKEREKRYYVDGLFIDAKIFASERTAEQSFVNGIYQTLAGYFADLETLQSQLLERTHVYFKCAKSTGLATFNLGDGLKTKENIELSFKINCFVPSYVKKDLKLQDTIKERTCDAIEKAIRTKEISMLDIFSDVQDKLVGYIDHFDLLGINGDVKLQTFVIEDNDAYPSIRRKLVLSDDNVLSLENDIDINFIALVDNTAETLSVEV